MSEINFRQLVGVAPRSQGVAPEAWLEIEEWAGGSLPIDFKEFVELYGEGLTRGHLYIPHPYGEEPLLRFMENGRRSFGRIARHFSGELGGAAFDPASVVPWAYSNWDGDQCFFVPTGGAAWRILLVFRQMACVRFYDFEFSEFIAGVIAGTALPPGWPDLGPVWKPVDGSLL
ncbi:hypothetical protein OG618_36755 [Kitasatospora sp. NBC_01246]|uniref:hypothetical protein n=1 Tax=Kitasatospora sp. NBC_01246 TaxID=2903570 RepID=UPI002E37045D|nr:hypothetical protein [Kitasatospora sp. NBC_01246]